MRLDKWLKTSRLIKRRTIAQEACDGGRVEVNGKSQKPGYTVKVGDKISLRFGERVTMVEVLSLTEHVRKEDAEAMYRQL